MTPNRVPSAFRTPLLAALALLALVPGLAAQQPAPAAAPVPDPVQREMQAVQDLLVRATAEFDGLQQSRSIALFDELIDKTESLRQQGTLPPRGREILAQAYEYRARAYFNIGLQEKASDRFRSLIQLQPTYAMSKEKVSPKVVDFFNSVKKALVGYLAVLVLCAAAGAAAQDPAVTVKEVQPFPYCAIAHQGPYTDMPAVVGRLVGAMQTQGLFPQVRGPMVGVYFNSPAGTPPQDLSWEAGFVITAQATPQPPLLKKVWEFRTVAVAMHVGPYEEGGATIVKIMDWLEANGYEPVGPVLERYLDQNPTAVKPEELRTEIWVPVAKR